MNIELYREADSVLIDGKDKKIRTIRARKQSAYEMRFSRLELLSMEISQ